MAKAQMLKDKHRAAIKKLIISRKPFNSPRFPKNVKQNSKNLKDWEEFYQMYELHRSVAYETINKEVGIGIVAKKFIDKGTKIFPSRRNSKVNSNGRILSHKELTTNISFTVNAENNINTAERYNALYGALSFINHACSVHANCTPYYPDYDRKSGTYKDSWKVLYTSKDVHPNEELTVHYSDSADGKYKCLQCHKEGK